MRIFVLLTLVIIISFDSHAQKVGLVLSGGGAKGLAHIGVIKALEENNIPIDYITGTSMGAIVGSLYAAGYSPDEMIKIVTSKEFLDWANGNIPEKYIQKYKVKEEDASWIEIKFNYDSTIIPTLPTNIIPPHSMDLAFLQLLSGASAVANYNFDSLFIPFRCVASDIYNNEPIIFSKGDLGMAVRASMTFPFYFKPISVQGKLLFDGGIYNNFPVDVMIKDFKPDFVIGSCVASNSLPPSEDNLLLQIENMIVSNTNYSVPDSIGILIEPDVKIVKLMDFYLANELIKIGYGATMAKMTEIKKMIAVRVDSSEINNKRKIFKQKLKPLVFKNIYINGLTYHQSNYVKKHLLDKSDTLTFEKFREKYFRIISDDYIESIYPRAKYNESTNYYNLFLNITKEKPFKTNIGGIISSDNMNGGFLAVEYKYLRNFGLNWYNNLYFGKLYTGAYSQIRIEHFWKNPLYFQAYVSYNNFDYYRGSTFIFYSENRPIYIITKDNNIGTEVSIPLSLKVRGTVSMNFFDWKSYYYQDSNFSLKDTSDISRFYAYVPAIEIYSNTLNNRNYPTKGFYNSINLRYYDGKEHYIPGNKSNFINSEMKRSLSWFYISIQEKSYFRINKKISLGGEVKLALSNHPLLLNYFSTLLLSPSYTPTVHSKSIYIEKLRNPSFGAGGITFIFHLTNYLHYRLESHHYISINPLLKTNTGFIEQTNKLGSYYQFICSSLVFTNSVANISFSLNYYPWNERKIFGQFNIGYLIFNKTMHP